MTGVISGGIDRVIWQRFAGLKSYVTSWNMCLHVSVVLVSVSFEAY